MSDMFDLQQAIDATSHKTRLDINTIEAEGVEVAKARRAYSTLVAKLSLELRANGMAVSMVKVAVEGDEDVASARYELDCAEARYKAACEVVNVDKRDIDILREQLNREWATPRREYV